MCFYLSFNMKINKKKWRFHFKINLNYLLKIRIITNKNLFNCRVKRNKQSGFDSKLGLFGSSGVTKSNSIKSTSSSSSGDRRLAQSAQMFHYQHQKQQMIAMEK